ncbi:MAG: urea ABC transporter permease subunit UrtB [Planctomycetaceae bacterium]|jgi:urea transport system permease protein|nr:urea ABC transporter permease subunit UrtB [Planctomycetaceae bacterium]MDP7277994.1 urea ABC transporter permease subunit UrtB [Planctomycetaceae bacterium]
MLFADSRCSRRGSSLLLLLVLLGPSAPILAADAVDIAGELRKLVSGDRPQRQAALRQLVASRDGRLVTFLEAYQQGNVYLHEDQVVVCLETKKFNGREMASLIDPIHLDPLTGRPPVDAPASAQVVPTSELKSLGPSGRERREVADAIRLLQLWSHETENRLAAIRRFGDSRKAEFLEPLGELIESVEVPETIRQKARESVALIELGSEETADSPETRTAAARLLGELASARALPVLTDLLKTPASLTAEERTAFTEATRAIESYQWKISWVQNLFYGLSLGSVLILVALGLAIIFGQMGVINMAHGELMMIGAYTTYEVQRLFGHTPDDPVNLFYIAALPASFLVAALVGWLIERLIVRHLYGRPLETLLATWGVGLILIQAVRIRYGDNIGVNSPTWLLGSFEPIQDLSISYNRVFIMALCFLCVLAVAAIMNFTRQGLLIRATVQNRQTAETLGVNTHRTDGLTFALGAGLAGIAGYAWTLIGGVTPDMGQNHIVDAFLVVVTGGVGELAGSVWAGMGLGVINKLIEPALGSATWAKVILLLLVIGFIQWKPAGLFPPKGRLADV